MEIFWIAFILIGGAWGFGLLADLDIYDYTKQEMKKQITRLLQSLSMFMIGIYVIVTFYRAPVTWDTTPRWTEHIVAVKDSQNINGTVIYRRGYINEELYYYYIVDTGEGMVTNKIPAKDTTFYETDSQPRVEWYKGYQRFAGMQNEYTKFKLYVPYGTVTDEFLIDLE